MVRPKKRFSQLIEEIDYTPWGPEEQALISEAVALAQEIGDEKLEYQARMRQTASANMSGATDVMLSSFAWCLAKHDADPRQFPADLGDGGADLMWQFKWMASTLRASPAFSQQQISAVLDDMQSHYQKAALGMSGVLTARFEDAWDAGRWDEAEALRVQLETTPRDEHSHCDACSRSQYAGFFAETGRDADAIRLVEELVEGGFSCGEEPEHALSRVLLPYLRAGRFDEARSAHLRSYRLAKDNADNLTIVANNIVFCAVSGNPARALALVERHLPWLAHDGLNVDAHFTALAAFAIALDSVSAAGHGETVVRGADAAELARFFGAHDGAWTASGLASACWATAERIGADFDARDGGTAHADRLRRMRELDDVHYDVPIHSDAFVAPVAAPLPTDPGEWYERATELAASGSANEALDAAKHAMSIEGATRRAQLLSLRVGVLVSLERTDEARQLLPERIAALRAAGLDAQADLEQRIGLALFGAGSAEDAAALDREISAGADLPAASRGDLALSRAALHLTAEQPDAVLDLTESAARDFAAADDPRVADATLVAVSALAQKNDADAAMAVIDRLFSDETLSQGYRARALSTRARLRGAKEQYADGAADADEFCRILAGLGASTSLAGAQVLAGALWEDAGEPEQAVSRYRLASRLIAQDQADATGADYRLARAMLAAGDAAEAAELLGDVLRREEQAEAADASRAVTAVLLARALASSGEFGQAVGAFGHASQLYAAAEQPVDQAMTMHEQAKILARFEEYADAVELLEQAVQGVRQVPEAVGPLTEVLHSLGQTYAAQQDQRAFGLFDEVAALAQQHEAGWLLADVTDSRARAFATAGRVDDAVSAALTAADGFAELGDTGSAGGSELFAARVLAGAERREEASAIYRTVLEHAVQIPPLRQVAALELGDVLEALGRTGEAAEVRALAEA